MEWIEEKESEMNTEWRERGRRKDGKIGKRVACQSRRDRGRGNRDKGKYKVKG